LLLLLFLLLFLLLLLLFLLLLALLILLLLLLLALLILLLRLLLALLILLLFALLILRLLALLILRLLALLVLLLLVLLILLLLAVLVPLLIALLVALRRSGRGLIRSTCPLLPLLAAWRHDRRRCRRFYLVWHALPLLIARAEGLRIAQGGHCCFMLPLADFLGALQPCLGLLWRHRPYPF
jgi:hypothetical protein